MKFLENQKYNISMNTNTAKLLGYKFSRMIAEKWKNQTKIADDMDVAQWTVSKLLKWDKAKPLLMDYYQLSTAIGLSESEFYNLYLLADHERLEQEWWTKNVPKNESDPDVAFFAKHGVTNKEKQKAILQMLDAFKDVK